MAKPTKTELMSFEDELAQEAAAAAAKEKSSDLAFISLKGGVMSMGDTDFEDNQMAAVILTDIFENHMYEGKYDSDVKQIPLCYARSQDSETLEPSADAQEAQAESCATCKFNEWGSAETGKGKACTNTRRLAVLAGGVYDKKKNEWQLYDSTEDFTSSIAMMKLPVTSTGNYATYVKQLAQATKRPTYGVITRIYLEADKKTQFKVKFEVLDAEIPLDVVKALKEKIKDAQQALNMPYVLQEEAPKKANANKKLKR